MYLSLFTSTGWKFICIVCSTGLMNILWAILKTFVKIFTDCTVCGFCYYTRFITILYQSRTVVRLSVRPFVRLPVMFLVNVSPSKLLDVATSNFAGA